MSTTEKTINLPLLNPYVSRTHFELITPEEADCLAAQEIARAPIRLCNQCDHLYNDSDGPVDAYHCSQKPHMANLEQFPNISAPKECFKINFWVTPFASAVTLEDVTMKDNLSTLMPMFKKRYCV